MWKRMKKLCPNRVLEIMCIFKPLVPLWRCFKKALLKIHSVTFSPFVILASWIRGQNSLIQKIWWTDKRMYVLVLQLFVQGSFFNCYVRNRTISNLYVAQNDCKKNEGRIFSEVLQPWRNILLSERVLERSRVCIWKFYNYI